MSDKRDRVTTEPGLGPTAPPGPSTLRSLDGVDPGGEGRNALVYCEPAPLVAVSDHKTLELETVRLARDIDPRTAATQLRLAKPRLVIVPVSDSGWPPEIALTSSQPPMGPGRRWRTPLVLLALLGALLLLVIARAATRRSVSVPTAQAEAISDAQVVAASKSPSTARPFNSAPASTAPLPASGEPIPLTATPIAPSSVALASSAPAAASQAPAPPSAASAVAASAPETAHAPPLPAYVVKFNSPPSLLVAAPSCSKPKRAIY
jgi:hypothetical protein